MVAVELNPISTPPPTPGPAANPAPPAPPRAELSVIALPVTVRVAENCATTPPPTSAAPWGGDELVADDRAVRDAQYRSQQSRNLGNPYKMAAKLCQFRSGIAGSGSELSLPRRRRHPRSRCRPITWQCPGPRVHQWSRSPMMVVSVTVAGPPATSMVPPGPKPPPVFITPPPGAPAGPGWPSVCSQSPSASLCP